jgi:hypothetical protein
MERMNRDIFPSQETIAAYPRLAGIVDNAVIKKAFNGHDFWAGFWKALFHQGGVISLLLLGGATIYAGFEVTLGNVYRAPAELNLAAAIAGVLGLLMQLALGSLRVRTRWLLRRFGSERVRSLKFQLLMQLGRTAPGPEADAALNQFVAQGIADIREEVRSGRGVIDQFEAQTVVGDVAPAPGPHLDADTMKQAWAYHDSARIDVQASHFSSRVLDGRDEMRTPGAIADILFLIAAVMTITELALRSWTYWSPDQGWDLGSVGQSWWFFLIWAFFVASASMMVFQNALGHEANSDRYAQYQRELERLPRGEPQADPTALMHRVYVVELIVLRELRGFLRDKRSRTYVY